VTVRFTTTTQDHFFWLSERDVELARQISAAARELDVPADPSAVQFVMDARARSATGSISTSGCRTTRHASVAAAIAAAGTS
jgi:hypothetical protein